MTTPDELVVILDRILNGYRDEKDITLLRQCLKGQNVVQVGNNIVNITEGKDIQIGDRTYYGLDAETIKASLREVLQENAQISLSSGLSPQTTSRKCVETSHPETQAFVPPPPPPAITTFEFEVVTVDAQGRQTKRYFKQAEYFIENLADGIALAMVAIPDGKFQMGASTDEAASQEEERPQHIVNIKSFFMGRYPITQAQWKVVATLPKINRELKLYPACFKGYNLPVERVSWLEVGEFCERLSRATGRTYRLPSEAEWEYACRAKTSTPFHFGKTITTNLANYCGQNENIHGVYRQQTTEVGSFPANGFGLCDMHGNVWEWCADYDHEDYHDAPLDGSAWLEDGNEEYRILRGGSWDSPPNLCRSASRFSEIGSVTDSKFGFRVVCSFV